MITPEQKRACKAIVSIFETGKAQGNPSACTILPDGAGISYGLHQATDASGSLDTILVEYIRRGGSMRAEAWDVLMIVQANVSTQYRSISAASPGVVRAVDMLRQMGADPIMAEAQEAVFDRLYWQPAQDQAEAMGLVEPLSWAVCYDTAIHSGPSGIARIRARFPEVPPIRGGDERKWTAAYVRARRSWLTSRVGIVAQTVYRMDAFLSLIEAGRWDLTPPFRVCGVELT